MFKAIIIDDEENARITLASLIQEYGDDVEIVAQCGNVPEGVLAINKLNPDVVFLDVEMPEYNGFELLDFFKEINFEIIFVTAYSHYAVRAFEVSAVDYLLKPVEIDGLKNAIMKLRQKNDTIGRMERLKLMREAYSGSDIQKIALPMSDGLLFIETNNIVFFEADRVYTNVYLIDGSRILVSKPMRVFEEMLSERNQFFRPHRSYLINLRYLSKYAKGESIIVMDNTMTIAISRDKKVDFEQRLKDLKIAF